MSVNTKDGVMTAASWGRTKIVKELVKVGALLDLQNTVCLYSVTYSVQGHAYILSCCILT